MHTRVLSPFTLGLKHREIPTPYQTPGQTPEPTPLPLTSPGQTSEPTSLLPTPLWAEPQSLPPYPLPPSACRACTGYLAAGQQLAKSREQKSGDYTAMLRSIFWQRYQCYETISRVADQPDVRLSTASVITSSFLALCCRIRTSTGLQPKLAPVERPGEKKKTD